MTRIKHTQRHSHVVGHEEVNREEGIHRGKRSFTVYDVYNLRLFKLNHQDVKKLVYNNMYASFHVFSSAASKLVKVASRLYASVRLVAIERANS